MPLISGHDWRGDRVRIEIFIQADANKGVVQAIGHAAYEGEKSNDTIAVETVDEFLPIRDFET